MILIDPAKPFFKGNLHTHTTASDGRKPPEEAIGVYKDLGYDFLAITDHWHAYEPTGTEPITVLRGIEYDLPFEATKKQALHLVALLPDGAEPSVVYEDTPEELIRKVKAVGGAVIFAHPAWSMNTLDVILRLKGVCAAEVYNVVSGFPYGMDRAVSTTQLDTAANHGLVFPMVSGDDTHYYKGEPGRVWNMVQAEDCTAAGILSALKAGTFYCTQGPEIRGAWYDPDERVLRIRHSEAEYVLMYSNRCWEPDRCIPASGKDETEYRPSEKEEWLRAEVMDKDGRRAWLSPFRI